MSKFINAFAAGVTFTDAIIEFSDGRIGVGLLMAALCLINIGLYFRNNY